MADINDILDALDPEELRVRAYYVYQERLRSGRPGDDRSDWEEAIALAFREAKAELESRESQESVQSSV